MTVAFKEEDFRKIFNENAEKKIKLEAPFRRSIAPFLRKINNDFEQEYITEGTVIDARDYKEELAALLFLYYDIISKVFKFNIRESFDDKTSQQIDAKINNNINKFEKEVIGSESNSILETINKKIALALAATINSFIEKEQDINNIDVADETNKDLNSKVDGRAKIIASIETGNMAENAKTIEEHVLIENDVVLGGIALASKIRDVWITTLDARTRSAHVRANLQEKLPYDFFFVGGEYLRYPRDPLGRIDNIANCRCEKVVKVF